MTAPMCGWLLFVIGLPIAWLASEFSESRTLRISLGTAAFLSTLGTAFVVGSLERLNYNAWYGGATSSLIHTAIDEIEDGNLDRVMSVLRRIRVDYRPTYENRAHYDEIVREAVEQMEAEQLPPGSRWDTSPFSAVTWIGHWENDTGFWLVIDDVGRSLEVQRSGDDAPRMQDVVLSKDARKLQFAESDWTHELTLLNKYEAESVWRNAETGEEWKRESLHKLIRATPAQRQFTQQGETIDD